MKKVQILFLLADKVGLTIIIPCAKNELRMKNIFQRLINSKKAQKLFWLVFWGCNLGIIGALLSFPLNISGLLQPSWCNGCGRFFALGGMGLLFMLSIPVVIVNSIFLGYIIYNKIQKKKIEHSYFVIIMAICVLLFEIEPIRGIVINKVVEISHLPSLIQRILH